MMFICRGLHNTLFNHKRYCTIDYNSWFYTFTQNSTYTMKFLLWKCIIELNYINVRYMYLKLCIFLLMVG